MERRTFLIGLISISGCTATSSEPREIPEGSIENCEMAYLRDQKSGEPKSKVVSNTVVDGWRRYTVESEWSHTSKAGEGETEIVDHWVKSFYYVNDNTVYRTEEKEKKPKKGREMDCNE